jgi:N-acetylneuraminic acid mutarotase
MPSPTAWILLIASAATAAASLSFTWKEAAPLPLGVVASANGMSGGRMAVAGGTYWKDGVKYWSSRADVYDASADRWVAAAPLPLPLAYGASLGGPAGLEIFGGNDGKQNHRDTLLLDPAHRAWRKTGALPDDRLMAAAARIGRATYLAGGCGDPADFSTCGDTILKRESAGAKWSVAGKYPAGPLALAAAVEHGGKLWIFGGAYYDAARTLFNRADAWSFDPATGKWRSLRPLPRPTRGVVAASYGRYIILLAGYSTTFHNEVLLYDTTADAYTPAAPLPLATVLPGVALDGRTLYIAGGEPKAKQRTPRVFRAELP